MLLLFHSSVYACCSVQMTPRVLLFRPSRYLVINNSDKPLLAPCDMTANIGIDF